MGRPRERVCLQDGLRLDLNRLARRGFIKPGANIGCREITWTHSHWGEVGTGMISADMSDKHEGWFRIQLGCACRKSNPDILVVQPAENWAAKRQQEIETARFALSAQP